MGEIVNFTTTESLLNVMTCQSTEPIVNATAAWPSVAGEEQPLGTVQIAIAVTSCLICSITVLGNLVVLGAFCTDRRLRTYTNYYIVGLSVSDLVAGLITMPLYTVYWVLGRWPFGPAVCDTYLYLNHVFIHISVLGILVLAADRYQAVYHPFKHLRRRTLRHATFMISISYVIPFLIWLPWCLLWPYIVGARRIRPGFCYPQYVESLVFSILAPICFFWIPVPITSVLYLRIYRVIRKSKQQRPVRMTNLGTSCSTQDPASGYSIPTADQQPPKNPAVLDIHSTAAPLSAANYNHTTELPSWHENPSFEADVQLNNHTVPSLSRIEKYPVNRPTTGQASDGGPGSTTTTKPTEHERDFSTRESHRAIRTLTLILVALLVSSVPWSVLVIIYSVCPSCIPLVLYQTSVYLAHMNSTVNPFCYAVANPLYLDALKRLGLCWRRTTVPTRAGRSSSRPRTISVQNTML
ncbi:muscarinic acetylcholine receptor M3-like [Patiria miniata]|uniref:G-protein coupled receptors family 1 profile domain-containing protein n=1 Tax=Patiria miniata TaxID=46514 RepID=A0A913ZK10_PATMI|nr:muscarinic acetylcholine receptor M3-like [Patiria miniata]